MRQLARAQHIPDACDTRLDLHRIRLRGNDHTYWGTHHASHIEALDQWRLRVRDGPALAAEVLSYPSDEYIRWYRGITLVYIGNPANLNTRSHRYRLVGVNRRMMIPLDNLVESSNVRLLDWNDSMIDIQLGMRFIDKVQAISAVRKWSISVGREYRVLKIANDPEILVSNIIQEVQVLFQIGCPYKRAWYARKFSIEVAGGQPSIFYLNTYKLYRI
ncbi:hypothetical protein M9H77_02844 [Catharanthus roseus]|uniref:Uncharacterized protein n=1 Tax=Catharanthus roseus TaxID=4058 RepID=A0ACC0C9L3_CATRO|nr:hypothetical protein M9H77_02844 [Catharanthus roseus]